MITEKIIESSFWKAEEEPFEEWCWYRHNVGGYCTPEHLAEYLHLHVTTIRRWLREGLMYGATRESHGWRINIHQAETWMIEKWRDHAGLGHAPMRGGRNLRGLSDPHRAKWSERYRD